MITVAAQLLTRVPGKPAAGAHAHRPQRARGTACRQPQGVRHRHVSSSPSPRRTFASFGADYRGLVVSMIHKFDGIPADVNLARERRRSDRRGAPHDRRRPRQLPHGRPAERHVHRLHRHADRQDRSRAKARSRSSATDDERATSTSTRSRVDRGRDDASAQLRAAPERDAGDPSRRSRRSSSRSPSRGRHRHRGAEQGPRPGGQPEEDDEEPTTASTRSPSTSPSTSARMSSRWATRRSSSASIARPARSTRRRSTGTSRPSTPRSSSAPPTTTRTELTPLTTSTRPRSRKIRKAFRKPERAAEDPHRHREAAHGLRRADPLLHVPRQADARPRAPPGHRSREPPVRGTDERREAVGFVLDFVGIFEKLEEALAFDSDVVAAVITTSTCSRNGSQR